jgi:hypothetical protein
MLLLIAGVLAVLWALGFFVFHVSTAAIHLVIAMAVVVALVHIVKGTSRGLPSSG